MKGLSLDLNCDMGESSNAHFLGNDPALMPLISSANIACGFHAGDPHVMTKTVQLALLHQVAIGAHPGLPDRMGFGRRSMQISSEETEQIVLYQVGALAALVKAEGGHLNHVKPHGALYNMAATNIELAEAIARAVHRFDPELVLYGLAGSLLIKAGENLGLKVAHEVFADRRYQPSGALVPRTDPDALIHDSETAMNQVINMVKQGRVEAADGSTVSVQADTLCLHGDHREALSFARSIHSCLEQEAIVLKAITNR